MKNKKKLIILAKNIDGGTGTFVTQLLKLTKLYSIKVCILEKPRFRKNIPVTIDIEYMSHRYSHKYNEFILLFKLINELVWMKNKIFEKNPDVVISMDTHCNMIGCIMKIISKKQFKLITTTHNNISAVANNKLSIISVILLKKIGHFLLHYADYQIGVSKGVSKDLMHFFSLKNTPQSIYYGLDIKKIKQLSNKPIDEKDKRLFTGTKKIILSIGRFENQKDFPTLLHAFALTHKKIHAILVIVGDGSQKNNLQRLCRTLNITSSVKFLGWKSNVYPYLKKADVFVLSSHYEGLPYVLIESLILGKAIISTACNFGPSELLLNGNVGILTPEHDYQTMSEHLISILTNTSLRKQIEKKSEIRGQFFNEKKMLQQYTQLIDTAIQKSSDTIERNL